MASQRMAWLPWAAAALLGLGIPRAFVLLYVVLLGLLWFGRLRSGPKRPLWLQWSTLWLVIFGVAYSVAQVSWGVWTPAQAHLPEIMAVAVLPAAALQAGWMLPRFGSSRLTGLILAYALGALVYALLSLALSRTPWWNLGETFQLNVRVPWGAESVLNMRSVEQRAFPALACLPVALPLLFSRQGRLRGLGLWLLSLALLACHLAWAYQGRIGLVAVGLAFLSWIVLVPTSRRRLWGVGGIAVATAALALLGSNIGSGRPCDERWWLQLGFVQHLVDAPWGGRLIQFSYRDCQPNVWLRFGSMEGASTFSPHSVVLDVWNDAGWPAALSLLLAMLPLLIQVLRGFWRSCQREHQLQSQKQLEHGRWPWPLALRWSMVSVLLAEWLLQPFFYSDQLMFSVGFVLAGALLAEFTADTPGDWLVAKPSHRGTFDQDLSGWSSPDADVLPADQPR